MFTLRKEQVDSFRQIGLARFEDRLLADLRTHHPEFVKPRPEADLRDFVREAIDQAERFGFRSERQVARYLALMRQMGRGFASAASTAWAGAILRMSGLTPNERLNRLEDALYYRQNAQTINPKRLERRRAANA